MSRGEARLLDDALAIWRAGVDAVRSDRLVQEAVQIDGRWLIVADAAPLDLQQIDRIAVVGAGKAGAGMAAGLEAALGDRRLAEKQVTGWINVPADCVRPLKSIRLHAARPAGQNEPTEAGLQGSRAILSLVESLGPRDVVLCLISGGGSALLPAPIDGISLADKQAVTRFLSGAGANIVQLNTVRKQLSRIKGGGLARACRAGRLLTLIISDVLGDPLDVIASGPTVPDPATPEQALAVLESFGARSGGVPPAVMAALEGRRGKTPPPACLVENFIIGNNATAVDAAGACAERLGYTQAMESWPQSEGPAEEVGRRLAGLARQMLVQSGPDCLISGGEPVVKLVDAARRGRGGRNQQLALAALQELAGDSTGSTSDGTERLANLLLLSGGTDGEDGPTDAAGAWCNANVDRAARRKHLDPADFLERNDAYTFFEAAGGLLKTGPTHTNVCDLRVVLVDRRQGEAWNRG